MCKHREMFSLAVLIGRGLVQVSFGKLVTFIPLSLLPPLCSVLSVPFEAKIFNGTLLVTQKKCTISSVGRAPDS